MRGPLLFLVMVALSVPAIANFDVLETQTLHDIPPLVVATECANELLDAKLDCDVLKSEARALLSSAGIATQDPNSPADPKRRPSFLLLRLACARFTGSHTFQLYGVTLRLDVVQDVLLPRDAKKVFPASTWSRQRTEVLGPVRLLEVQSDMLDLVRDFIEHYKQANANNR